MPTQIKQIWDDAKASIILRVSGEMFLDDAKLLGKIGKDARTETGDDVILDLADLDFLDSEAAHVLRELDDLEGFKIEGLEIFLQTVVNEAERHAV
ncbi:MAG: STAS domain-containing protein [Acidobacteriota bacterium]